MRTLSEEREQQLISAIKQAVHLVDNQNMTPDQAIEKVAREHSWGADLVKFACQAYNTGRQTAQRQANDGPLDKFAEFQLADPDKVIDAIWPKTVKSASELDLEMVSGEYGRGPAWLAVRDHQARQKAAAAPLQLVDKAPEPYQPEPHVKMAKAYNRHLTLKRAAEDARHQAAVAYENLLSTMGQLGDYFKQAAYERLPFSTVEYAVNTMFPQSTPLMDWVYSRNRMKEARAADVSAPTTPINRNALPFNLILACEKLAAEVVAARKEHYAAQEAVTKHAEDHLVPFASTPSQPQVSSSLIPEEPVKPKIASWLGGAAVASGTRAMVDKALGGLPTSKEQVDDMYLDLEDPQQETELRKIRTQTMLADLLRDEVIKGFKPEQVLSAYNEIAQMAPRASMQPLAMRALLRRRLQGNMEPFEAKEITEIEKGLLQQKEHAPSTALSSGTL